jgi:hypothetical protein
VCKCVLPPGDKPIAVNKKYIYIYISPSSDGKPEAATAVVVAPDDGHEHARNMLSCI